jgi:hypothetical protein
MFVMTDGAFATERPDEASLSNGFLFERSVLSTGDETVAVQECFFWASLGRVGVSQVAMMQMYVWWRERVSADLAGKTLTCPFLPVSANGQIRRSDRWATCPVSPARMRFSADQLRYRYFHFTPIFHLFTAYMPNTL